MEHRVAGIDALDVPPEAEHVWLWFWTLDGGRQSGQFGPQAIAHGDVAAWARLAGESPAEWELGALRAMDAARRSALAEEPEKPQLTAEAFDRTFG